jgi:tetratricopeptide (TPR) repeat protein
VSNNYRKKFISPGKAMTPEGVRRREKILGRNPWGGHNHNALGLEFFQGRFWETSAREFKIAAEINPWNARFKANLSRAYLAWGRWKDAEFWALEALRQKPDESGALFCLGLFYEKHGKTGAALDCYRRCAASKPPIGIRADLEENIRNLMELEKEKLRSA